MNIKDIQHNMKDTIDSLYNDVVNSEAFTDVSNVIKDTDKFKEILTNTRALLIATEKDLKKNTSLLVKTNNEYYEILSYIDKIKNDKLDIMNERIKLHKEMESFDVEKEKRSKELSSISVKIKELEPLSIMVDENKSKLEQQKEIIDSNSSIISRQKGKLESQDREASYLEDALEEIAEEISDAKGTRKVLQKELVELESAKDSLSVFSDKKDSLLLEIDVLKTQVEDEKNKFNILIAQQSDTTGIITKIQNVADKKLQDKKDELAKLIANSAPLMNNLDERESKVSQQEQDMKVIISRYKRLYDDKGSGFKI